MGYAVTPSRRRIAMAVMLLLAITGGIVRKYAPNPSTLRDVGTLLLVLWLPAVGNLLGYLRGRIPRSPPPVTEFAAGSPFKPHLELLVETVVDAPSLAAASAADDGRFTLLVGRHGFTARCADPLATALGFPGAQALVIELLHPRVALRKLAPGTAFHLLAGTIAIAKGSVSRTC
jgi:hypothetical protein